jgi:uncharacterized protein (TIGR02145 family)
MKRLNIVKFSISVFTIMLIGFLIFSSCKKDNNNEVIITGACESKLNSDNYFYCFNNLQQEHCNSRELTTCFFWEGKTCSELGYTYNNSDGYWYAGEGDDGWQYSGNNGNWPQYAQCDCQFSKTFGIFTDPRDGNTYQTVTIGTQTWFAENLRYSGALPNITDNNQWYLNTTGAYCYYNNNSSLNNPYGKLYNWYAVNSYNLCPSGWHIPSDEDFKTLEITLGMTQTEANLEGTRFADIGIIECLIGNLLKSTCCWLDEGVLKNGNNLSGFNALPSGERRIDGNYYEISSSGWWWCSNSNSTYEAWYRGIPLASVGVFRGKANKTLGCSIRCIKD